MDISGLLYFTLCKVALSLSSVHEAFAVMRSLGESNDRAALLATAKR